MYAKYEKLFTQTLNFPQVYDIIISLTEYSKWRNIQLHYILIIEAKSKLKKCYIIYRMCPEMII